MQVVLGGDEFQLESPIMHEQTSDRPVCESQLLKTPLMF
jgi:hypothetical protein